MIQAKIRWNPWASLPKATWRWWHHGTGLAWRGLTAALAVGLSTTLAGMLMGVYYFGLLTPGAVATNLLLIPLASWATLSGFISLVLGLAGWESGAGFFNHAAALVLLCIQGIVRGGVKVPGAFLSAQFAAPWLGGPTIAVLGVSLLAGYGLGWRRSFGGFWPPFVLVALVLMFGMKFG